MSPKTLVGLILCNLIWSVHPALGKVLLEDFTPIQMGWLRYMSALLAYVVIVIALRLTRKTPVKEFFLLPKNKHDALFVLLIGFMAFCFSPLTQINGLAVSRATDNALIVAMEPLFVVILAWLVLKERIAKAHLLAFVGAFSGFILLSGISTQQFDAGFDVHLIGNFSILISLFGEATYSVAGRKLTLRNPPLGVFGSTLLVGVIFLTLAMPFAGGLGTPHFTPRSLLGLLWIGPLGTSLSYLYWMVALAEAPVAALALTLFIQPVFGSIWGVLFLGDTLTSIQGVGGALIVGSVVGYSFWSARGSARKRLI